MLRANEKAMNEFALLDEKEGIPLFYPFVAPETKEEVLDTLNSRWIGQGPKVNKFEKEFAKKLGSKNNFIATGSGTDSLHLAYILANIQPGDEVITPVFTCTATNLPILYEGAVPVFADIDPQTMNISCDDIEHRISAKTKAIVAVDYGGIPANYKKLREIAQEHNLLLISDSAQSVGSKFNHYNSCDFADFTAYSFQAIKTITTADGGMLSIKDHNLYEKAKRLRWFGIDRSLKQLGTWENDISELGYKYQMNDLCASLGLASLKYLDEIVKYRKSIMEIYLKEINHADIEVITDNSNLADTCPWLCTILVKNNRFNLMKKLRENGIESAQVHYRNDRYAIFGGRKGDLPNMDALEDKYLVLPIHHKVKVSDCRRICDLINEGW